MEKFTIQLIQGSFSKEEASHLIAKMIDVKIKFHEDKISNSDNEEDIKMRETRIKQLQKELYEARLFIQHKKDRVNINSTISL